MCSDQEEQLWVWEYETDEGKHHVFWMKESKYDLF